VRFTIERMRMLVLAAGVLLLVVLVAFLAVGKWKNPFNRRDLPQRLGIEIRQEANGVTYTQARGGQTLFKIHASKVVQLKKGNALLHDVKIELYGTDGSRVDRIEGSEFEYDQKAGTAKAPGAVEITLMRPGVAPAIAPKVAAKQVVGDKRKDAPMASVAEAAARGEVHVKTSGLTFDQNSGVATTSERVTFSMAQGSGSAMGATFDSQKGTLVLDRAIELTARRGAETVQIHARHAEFERESQICLLRAAVAGYKGGEAAAGDAKLLFRDDGSVVRLDALNNFTLTTATGSRLTAHAGQIDFDERNQPRHGRLDGGVVMDSTSQKGSQNRKIHGAAPTAELKFTAQGKLHRAHLERGVVLDSEEQSEQAGQRLRLSRHWRSPVADAEFRESGRGRIELGAVYGSGGVVITGESQRGKGSAAPFRFSADKLTGKFGSNSTLMAMSGVGRASIEETTAAGTRQSTRGDRLEAHFAAPAAAGAKRATGGDVQFQSATVEGHVVLTQEPAAKSGAPAPWRATAGRADYTGAGEWLHLTLSPRVENGAMQLTASKVDVSRASGDAFAHGNVKASWTGAGAGSRSQQGRPGNSLVLGGQGPAHVVAAEAELHHAAGEAIFRGRARLWQQGNSIAAPVIVLDQARHALAASTRDAADPVRIVLVSAGGAAPGAQAAKSRPPSVVRVRGGDLKYSDAERKAMMRGGVLGMVVAETATAASVSNEVEVTLLPAGQNAGKNGGEAQVERVTARGHVALSSGGRRGSGEQLVFTSATGEYVLTGTDAAPPRMTDPGRGSVSGQALIFHGRDDSVSIEGGRRKTTAQTMAPK
jgi:lipopolysaccharide export system protein LptA